MPGLPTQALVAAADAADRRAQFVACWAALTDTQKVFLNTWRECRFNANKAFRVLSNTAHHTSKTGVTRWAEDAGFEYVRSLMRSASVEEILNRDYLAVRQDDVVETLLTPQPILHQGFATGHFEVQAASAGKANEVLMRLGGHLKDKDVDINVGLVGPSLIIQVMQADGGVIDVAPRNVDVQLAEPDADWLES